MLLILVAIGAAGYLAYQNIHKTSSAKASNTPSISPSTSPSASSSSGNFVVKEWGVKFVLASSLQSTKLVQTTRTDGTSGTYYAFTTARIQALGGKCAESATAGFGDTVTLYRFAQKPIATPDGELLNASPINGYYYVLSSPSAPCSSFDANAQMHDPSQTETNDRLALKQSISSLSAAQ